MNRLGGITGKRVAIGLAAFIIVGGFVLALLSNSSGLYGSLGTGNFGPAGYYNNSANSAVNAVQGDLTFLGSSVSPGYTQVIGQVTTSTTTMVASTTVGYPIGGLAPPAGKNVTQGSPSNGGGLIEFSSDLSIRTTSPQQAASGVVALAYSVGGYVAYQSTYSNSAYVVIRVPASQYQQVLGKIEAMGTVLGLTSNSNDVSVQYTDLNATLMSLQTEQGALLKLLNQSSAINSTLAIETQLQQVNTQINEVESQILQTRTLIQYSTIDVTISETAQAAPLSMSLSATPTNGTSPLSVTFNAVVKGGAQPYLVNYNFGDGYASQGQIVIHTYFQPGTYKVLVSTTDQNGTVVSSSTTVKVAAAPSQTGIQSFFGSVANLFTNVVEGIVEVAVVVLPIAAVGAAVIIPIQRHGRNQKVIKQSQ